MFVVKIIILVLIIVWIGIFVTDYFRARKSQPPLICLKENNKKNNEGEYYSCTSLGYKYFEYKDSAGQVTYGFKAAFLKSEIERKMGD